MLLAVKDSDNFSGGERNSDQEEIQVDLPGCW